MAEFLLEILCEEIPARMQVRAGDELAKMLTGALADAGIKVKDVRALTGPRRLVYVANIPLRSPDVSEERKGPRVGSPERAIEGFLRGAGLDSIDQAEIRSTKKGDVYVAVIEKAGEDSADILARAIPDIMSKFPWPKSMKSGSSSFRWVRPLSSILCLLDGKVVPFEVGGVPSGDQTSGHRRHGAGPYAVKNFADYQKTLEGKGHVVLSADARKAKILADAQAACKAAGLELVADEGLLNEVAGLAEWPVVILGDMDPAFLKLPAEVIRLSMRTHQKYFAVRNPKTGELAPNFIVVANQDAPDGGKAIAAGNSRVLSARLADAVFFQEEDAKHKLIDYYDKLDGVVFHKKLGSVKDKAERVAALARELAPKVGADPDAAALAAKLAKCDLVTNMVVEFTSLQGQIGRLMYEREHQQPHPEEARRAVSKDEAGGTRTLRDAADAAPQGEGRFDPEIALAIEEHYKPQGPSDTVPTNPVSVAVALADKLDTLSAFWMIGEIPTGSKDPYALRRSALGLIHLILKNQNRISINEIIIETILTHYKPFSLEFYAEAVRCWRKGATSDASSLFQIAIQDTFVAFFQSGTGHSIDFLSDAYKYEAGEISKFNYKNESTKHAIEYSELLLPSLDRFLRSNNLIVGIPKTQLKLNNNSRAKVEKTFDEMAMKVVNDHQLDLLSFILDRLKVHLRDEGMRHDIIDAVFALGGDDLVDIVNRINALQSFITTDEGTNLLAGYKRASNILAAEAKKGDLPDASAGKGTQAEETALFDALSDAKPKIETALGAEDYAGAMTALASLRGPIDAFFDAVTVNSDEPQERANRLALLLEIKNAAQQIADFDKIEN